MVGGLCSQGCCARRWLPYGAWTPLHPRVGTPGPRPTWSHLTLTPTLRGRWEPILQAKKTEARRSEGTCPKARVPGGREGCHPGCLGGRGGAGKRQGSRGCCASWARGPPTWNLSRIPLGVGGGEEVGGSAGRGEQLSKSLKGPKALGTPVRCVRNTRTEPGQR